MLKSRPCFAWFIGALTIVMACGVRADDPCGDEYEDPKQSEEARAECASRRSKIKEEIDRLGVEHAWAGSYYHGDGRGVNQYLEIAPDNGFTFKWRGCLGVYDLNYGSVTVDDDGVLHLKHHFKNDQRGFQGLAEALIPVQWGERHYLVPTDEIGEFCNSIYSQFGEPRERMHGSYFLRSGDHEKKVEGLPTLSARYRNYLITKPIRATVTKIIESKVEGGKGGWRFRESRLTIDAGKSDRLIEGMVMELADPEPKLPVRATVIRCGGRSSEVEIEQPLIGSGQLDAGEPKVGWRFVAGPRMNDHKTELFADLSLDEAVRRAASANKVVMVFVRADWGAESAMVDKVVWADDIVKRWVDAHCVAIQIDVTRATPPELERFKLSGFPMVLFLDAKGKEIGRLDELWVPTQFVGDANKILTPADQ